MREVTVLYMSYECCVVICQTCLVVVVTSSLDLAVVERFRVKK